MLFYILYYGSMIILIPGIIFSIYAQIRISTTFKKYSHVQASSNMTAAQLSRMLLERNGLNYISVQQVPGSLTDNYNPQTEILSLSESTYSSNSVAALAVAAHEVGHALQKRDDYKPMKLRSILVPVTNFGSRLALPIAIIGLIIEWIATSNSGIQAGKIIVAIGILAYALTSIFALITLPVELNASRRAGKILYDTGTLNQKETSQAKQVLHAAALTYVASLLVSLLYLLRFILILSQFSRKEK